MKSKLILVLLPILVLSGEVVPSFPPTDLMLNLLRGLHYEFITPNYTTCLDSATTFVDDIILIPSYYKDHGLKGLFFELTNAMGQMYSTYTTCENATLSLSHYLHEYMLKFRNVSYIDCLYEQMFSKIGELTPHSHSFKECVAVDVNYTCIGYELGEVLGIIFNVTPPLYQKTRKILVITEFEEEAEAKKKKHDEEIQYILSLRDEFTDILELVLNATLDGLKHADLFPVLHCSALCNTSLTDFYMEFLQSIRLFGAKGYLNDAIIMLLKSFTHLHDIDTRCTNLLSDIEGAIKMYIANIEDPKAMLNHLLFRNKVIMIKAMDIYYSVLNKNWEKMADDIGDILYEIFSYKGIELIN